jgi:hypothetical protein
MLAIIFLGIVVRRKGTYYWKGKGALNVQVFLFYKCLYSGRGRGTASRIVGSAHI